MMKPIAHHAVYLTACIAVWGMSNPILATPSESNIELIQLKEQLLESGNPSPTFGFPVALSSNLIAVGDADQHAVYLYARTNNIWTFQQVLSDSNQNLRPSSIAIDEDVIVVGDRSYNSNSGQHSSMLKVHRDGNFSRNCRSHPIPYILEAPLQLMAVQLPLDLPMTKSLNQHGTEVQSTFTPVFNLHGRIAQDCLQMLTGVNHSRWGKASV